VPGGAARQRRGRAAGQGRTPQRCAYSPSPLRPRIPPGMPRAWTTSFSPDMGCKKGRVDHARQVRALCCVLAELAPLAEISGCLSRHAGAEPTIDVVAPTSIADPRICGTDGPRVSLVSSRMSNPIISPTRGPAAAHSPGGTAGGKSYDECEYRHYHRSGGRHGAEQMAIMGDGLDSKAASVGGPPCLWHDA
jgi:hypothetical protein